MVAINKTLALVIAVIVIAIALAPLEDIFALRIDFLPDNKIVNYATCALAVCTNGFDTQKVSQIPCLESDATGCQLTCNDLKTKTYDTETGTIVDREKPLLDATRYCGAGSAQNLQVMFDLDSPIILGNGQLNDLARPKWVHTSYVLDWNDIQQLMGRGDSLTIDRILPIFISPNCFSNFEEKIYTPLLRPTVDQSVVPTGASRYPTAVYVDDYFISGGGADCSLSGDTIRMPRDANPEIIDKCQFKPSDASGKIVYRIRAFPIADLDDSCGLVYIDRASR